MSNPTAADAPAFDLVDFAGVEQITGESRSTISRKMQLGIFPQPTHRAGNKLYWHRSAVMTYLGTTPRRRRILPLGVQAG